MLVLLIEIVLYFNPIIGLILTVIIMQIALKYLLFQSHYRSDFNMTVLKPYKVRGNFNPIIGLILTHQLLYQIVLQVYFNPIIGLILTLPSLCIGVQVWGFQSHYRSDFNSI